MGSELDAREAKINCEFSEFKSLETTTNRHMWSPGFGCHGILKTLFSPCNIMFSFAIWPDDHSQLCGFDLRKRLDKWRLYEWENWLMRINLMMSWQEMEQITSLVLSSWFKVTYVTCDFSVYVYTSTTIHTHTYSMTINLSRTHKN